MHVEFFVKCTGHGLSFNNYPTSFTFGMNVERMPWSDDEHERIRDRARYHAKNKTACECVTVHSIELKDEEHDKIRRHL